MTDPEPEVGGQIDASDVLLAIDNALVQVSAAEQGLVLARRMVERLVGAELGAEAEADATDACTHPQPRRDQTFMGWVCLDCGHEETVEQRA